MQAAASNPVQSRNLFSRTSFHRMATAVNRNEHKFEHFDDIWDASCCADSKEIEVEIGMLGNHFRERCCVGEDSFCGCFHRLVRGLDGALKLVKPHETAVGAQKGYGAS